MATDGNLPSFTIERRDLRLASAARVCTDAVDLAYTRGKEDRVVGAPRSAPRITHSITCDHGDVAALRGDPLMFLSEEPDPLSVGRPEWAFCAISSRKARCFRFVDTANPQFRLILGLRGRKYNGLAIR